MRDKDIVAASDCRGIYCFRNAVWPSKLVSKYSNFRLHKDYVNIDATKNDLC